MTNNLHRLLILLHPFSIVYGMVMRLRETLFRSRFLQRHTFPVPVISVGNLTMGGSGKTPVVIHLARFFLNHGYKPAVVSRGYGGKATAPINVVSDGTTIFLDSFQGGDEPRLIAEEVPKTVVLTGKKRKDPCLAATKEFNCDIIILDDGFQHLAVERDVDVVLFNSSLNLKKLRVVPAGVLREPLTALQRADCFVITDWRSGKTENGKELQKFLENGWYKKPVYSANYVPHCLLDKQGNSYPLDHLDAPAFAFCGIAAPHRFNSTLSRLPLNICNFSHYSDHQKYSQRFLSRLIEQAKQYGAEALITTEKDMVKIKAYAVDYPLYALAMKVEIDTSFENFLLTKITQRKT
ncbi:MAG: tetraacyldisaccharide 4'-kinase [Desulfocapsaceae bacterium]|nr:tetraacyldisaccharide 4'-kinase [Desulfocapsaceae bacterium]